MSERPSDLTALRQRNDALAEQLRRLVQTEQRLSMSQRDLNQQLRRVDALNDYAMNAVVAADMATILESAMEMLFSIYPFEQGLALIASPRGVLIPAAACAVPGREGHSKERISGATSAEMTAVAVPEVALIGTPTALRESREIASALLDITSEVYGEASVLAGGEGQDFAIILPIHGPHPPHRSAFVLRRPDTAVSFHDRLPTDDDRPFLNLVGRTVGVALTNAHLVTSLKASYSELERTQRELVAQERLAAIGELAAVVAHEVRNPLGIIYNSVSALARIAHPVEEVRPLLDIVREEASRVNRTVTDLLEFARPSVLAKLDQPLSGIAEDAVASVQQDAKSRGISLRLDTDENVRAHVDGHLLRRAILNLIDNATHASTDGGTVEVRVLRDAQFAIIEVEDGGAGIAEDDREHIFEPFFTTKSVGTGLGLAVVKRFAESHGGDVSIRSSEDAGTVFTICLMASSGLSA